MNKNLYMIMRNQIGYNDSRIHNDPYCLYSNKKIALKAMQTLRKKEGKHPKYAFHVWVLNKTLNVRVSVSSFEENKAELAFHKEKEFFREMEHISDEMTVQELINRLSKYHPDAKLPEIGICIYGNEFLNT